MAKTPEAVRGLLEKVWKPARKAALADRDALQELIAEEGGNFKLAAWDWRYYAEKLRARRCDFEESEVKPYFQLDRVIEAAFYGAQKLFGLTFHPVDVPVWHPDVRSWEVRGADGGHVGIFYGDYFARPSKHGGAWMGTLRDQEKLTGNVRPLVLNVMNFNKGEPTLLSFEDARTLFHEMGHGLHGLLSNVTYPTVSCTSVLTDWVELPSQLYEHWFEQPEVLRKFARHYNTGEPIPEALVEKLMAAKNFDRGCQTLEYISSALVDLDLHLLPSAEGSTSTPSSRQTLDRIGMPEEIAMRHRPPHFTHVFSGGYYASAYYSYMWSEVLDADAFAAFEETGDIFNPEVARRALPERAVDRRLARSGRALRRLPRPAADRRRAPEEARLRRRGGMIDLHTAGHRRGVVCAPHAAAAEAGRAILGEGGNALEAMVAMAASIAAVYPHMNHIGGDGFWLVREPNRRVRAIMAAGPAGSLAKPELYREHETIPSRGPLAALTVPGAIGGWMLALEAARAVGGKGCRSTLLLHAAIGQARDGYVVAKSQARLTTEKLAELKDVPGFADDLPARRQAAGGRHDAQAERARLHARSSGARRPRRFLSRRCRARDRRRPGEDRQPGDARGFEALSRQHRRAAERQAQCRHALQHAAADAGARLADHPRAVRAPARPRGRELRVRPWPRRGDQARLPRARPRRHRSGAAAAAARAIPRSRNSSTPRFSRSTAARRRNGRRPTARATRSGWAPPTPRASRCPTSSRSIGSSAPAACCPRPAC